jgi:hypothetical protein
MFPTLGDVTKLIDDAKSLRVSAVLRDAAAIQVKVADTIDLFLDPTAPKQACDCSKAIADLESCKVELSTRGATETPDKNMDPATIILIINAVIGFLKTIHDWRHPPTPKPAG